MVWCSGWKLASAISNAGGLGIIGAGSMYPEVLRRHIQKCKSATTFPFGVNVPLMYPDLEAIVQILVEESVPIVITSAGNPNLWTSYLKSHGILVVHVISSVAFALKAVAAGVDAIVAEGFEAGGHNGREETTTFCLLPMVRKAVAIPLIAAGGIASGQGILAALALGADGVQIGTRFVATTESSAHSSFKELIVGLKEGQTELTLKELSPVRLVKNKFYEEVQDAYRADADPQQLQTLLGTGRAKAGMFEGDLDAGELEIGQASGLIDAIQPAGLLLEMLWRDFLAEKNRICSEYSN